MIEIDGFCIPCLPGECRHLFVGKSDLLGAVRIRTESDGDLQLKGLFQQCFGGVDLADGLAQSCSIELKDHIGFFDRLECIFGKQSDILSGQVLEDLDQVKVPYDIKPAELCHRFHRFKIGLPNLIDITIFPAAQELGIVKAPFIDKVYRPDEVINLCTQHTLIHMPGQKIHFIPEEDIELLSVSLSCIQYILAVGFHLLKGESVVRIEIHRCMLGKAVDIDAQRKGSLDKLINGSLCVVAAGCVVVYVNSHEANFNIKTDFYYYLGKIRAKNIPNRQNMTEQKKVELLAPAGNLEKMKIALNYGADAVYGGTSTFSLRIRSGKEFDMDAYKEGIEYAHERGKKVYTTINSFPFNSQVKLYENHIAKMAELEPDALIVSSPGIVKMAKQIAPNIPIHLSTQANVMNALDAQVYYDMGVTRIIAAREISLKDCEAIKSVLPDLELEVFVHGSMCFAYSGRCLISAVQTGRVPNRGSCANDCRFPYEIYAHNPESGTTFRLDEEEGVGTYIMNAKDMNLASHVDEILASGVIDSLKIEGRTKSPYYTGVVTKAYREAIDDFYAGKFDAEKYQAELHTTQNRGFTDAYLISRPFERKDTESHDFSIQNGTHQVAALVSEDGKTWRCKDKTCVGDEVEIVLPVGATVELVDNEYGRIEEREGRYWLTFKKIIAVNGKAFECVHSGDLNDILLPAELPGYTILRRGIAEALEKKGLTEDSTPMHMVPKDRVCD